MDIETQLNALRNALNRTATSAGQSWLDSTLGKLGESEDITNDLSLYCAMARRKFGDTRVTDNEPVGVAGRWPLTINNRLAGDIARLIFILTAIKHHPGRSENIVQTCYRQGDDTERYAITLGLSLFPDPGTLKPVALETGRTNSKLLFSAIALNNPFAAEYYDNHEFNQLVLKSLFLELPIEQVVGLQQRGNSELARMCEDYINERRLAGRHFPKDIWLAITPYASSQTIELMKQAASEDDGDTRYYAIKGLSALSAQHVELMDFLHQRLKTERNPPILEMLENV